MKRIVKVVLAAAVVVFTGCEKEPSEAVTSFYGYLEDGKADQAADMVTGSGMAMVGRDKMAALLSEETSKISAQGGIESIEFLSEDVQGETATVDLKMQYGNGESRRETLNLIKVDGQWKLRADM